MNNDAYYQLKRLSRLADMVYEFHFTLKNDLRKTLNKKEQLVISDGMSKHMQNIVNKLETAVNRYEQLIDYNRESSDAALAEANKKIESLQKELAQFEMGGYAWK